MELPDTITKSNFSKENAQWMDTITIPCKQIFPEKSPQFARLSSLTATGTYVITANVPENSTIAFQSRDFQGITIDAADTSGLGALFKYRCDITTGSILQMTETSSLNEFGLVTLGIQLAKMLILTLDQIRSYNSLAIYPIVSIMNSYLEEAEELFLGIAPFSSTQSIARITNRETAESEGTDVQGESFFRFLDELESGAYAADDITDGE